jgi:hypothetical protein
MTELKDSNYLVPKSAGDKKQSGEDPHLQRLQQEIRNLHKRLGSAGRSRESEAEDMDLKYEKSVADLLTGRYAVDVAFTKAVYFEPPVLQQIFDHQADLQSRLG